MAKTVIDKKEKDNLQVLFECLDENKDGEITLKEFIANYKSKFNINLIEGEMAKIIKQIDMNNDRNISFTEFLVGACNKVSLLTDHNLKSTFSCIDYDKDGIITREDLRVFMNIKNDYMLGNVIEEADDDCDGGITYKEFCLNMLKLLRLENT
jgi:Ca2+-binding EF-hand superfamily protein